MHLYEESLVRKISVNCWLNKKETDMLFQVAEKTPEKKRVELLESIASQSDKREYATKDFSRLLATRLALQKKIREMKDVIL